ncbi:hypothetical protein ABH931_003801 [Streptacidiphilus sp. MAP12-33]|uniref:hypothetical protein n=1 Tax=Streptacidiphilus sp. MAP12-33 TaxID=3156266 RepID=UPI003514D05C
MRQTDTDADAEFAASRAPWLRRTAYVTENVPPGSGLTAVVGFSVHGYEVDLSADTYSRSTDALLRKPDPSVSTACTVTDGIEACLQHEGRDEPPAALTAVGGLKGLLKHVHVYGLDPANWTTDVLP